MHSNHNKNKNKTGCCKHRHNHKNNHKHDCECDHICCEPICEPICQHKCEPFDCNVPFDPYVDLSIQKTGNPIIGVNDLVTYTITVRNNGTINANNITIRDVYGSPILAHIPIPVPSVGTITVDGSFALNSGSFVWYINTLVPGAIATLTFTMQPTGPGQIFNYTIITNYNEIKQDINFFNNESRVITIVSVP